MTTTAAPGAQALAYEWIKFRSVRSTVWTTVATAVLPVLGAVFVATTGSLQSDDTVLGGSLTLSVVAQMLAAVVGALVMTGEYSSGTIRTTFAARPRRSSVLAAKAVLVAGVMYALALASCTLAYLVGDALLPEGRYAQGEPLPALFGIAASFAEAAVLGLAVGTLVRHSAGAVTTVIGLLLLPSLFGPLFGDAERWIAGLSPTAALEKLTQTSDAAADAVGSTGPWPSLLLVAAYTTALALGALVLLRRRDV
ncbi:ABC transporter permease subunit [Streptomyces rubiginosohelvolus]|uniref:ABC transporter permease subunit n=1 Tax=Streptomyces TaxID=1883 RepID=UPI00190A3DDD|nr:MULTISPECIES: ABC transporter permease subunit [unclassified Streptomyces]MBK3530655.1 ABC transporter permease subunit [Streptomyces sp. MBT72]MBK3537245.1 ABC transporter permease subunit [Streptomyces sp. MBT67]MBK3551947.1 ABC transporter permease subunit [Streptomyces sp. MBT61]MBK6031691.1 ABC transporter permease subunit [Streptomyces sp. MBT59]